MIYKKNLARYLRKNLSTGEKILWELLRRKNFEGLRFRRQHPIDNYIVDFYCKEENFIIEVDGPLHDNEESKIKDKIRQTYLENKGYRMMRIKERELNGDPDIILKEIKKFLEKN